MHEMSIARSILEMAVEETIKAGATQIHSVSLRIGEMSGVVPDSLSFCWDMIAEGGPAEGSKLDIELVELIAQCQSCQQDFKVDQAGFECPGCGSTETELIQGREMTLQSIQAE